MKTLTLNLTDREIELLRNSTSDLQDCEPSATSLLLKIANSILDSDFAPKSSRDNEVTLFWRDYIMNRPKVDLTKCKVGQKLLSNQGKVFTYMGKSNSTEFPHRVLYSGDNLMGTRTNEGWTFRNRPLPMDEDIIYIFPMEGN